MGPLLTVETFELLCGARDRGTAAVTCSLDLERSTTCVGIGAAAWSWDGRSFPYRDDCKARTIYHWTADGFEPVARYSSSLIKLVPTAAGPPTFEIDGIKMLPTAERSPFEDARRKVASIEPRGKRVLDTCGGLGYFAAWCIEGGATRILSYEKNADVLWLRGLNPWSPPAGGPLSLVHGDVTHALPVLPSGSVDAVLHDPPRFGIAGELYSQDFYDQLARVLRRRGRLFHYTGAPNRAARGRDLAGEVSKRLRHSGFTPSRHGDGVLAIRD